MLFKTIPTLPQDHRIAKLAAYAILLHVLESIIPSPLPGVKPGIANIVVLYVLYRDGWVACAWVNLLRVLAGSLILGSFLTPTFMLSVAGASASLLALVAAQYLPRAYFGALSLSICAAFAHMAGQLILVRIWLIPNAGILYLLPVLMSFALLFGVVNGLITARLLQLSRPAER